MLAVCYTKSDKTLTIRQGREKFHDLVDGQKRMEVIPEVILKFDLVQQSGTDDIMEDPSFMPGGPTPRRGCARVAGTLGIEEWAKKVRMDPDELVFWMLHDPRYDTPAGFIIRRDDGKKILDLYDFVLEAPDGYDNPKRFCRACQKELQTKGVSGHEGGREHTEAMEAYRTRLREKILAVGMERRPEEAVAFL